MPVLDDDMVHRMDRLGWPVFMREPLQEQEVFRMYERYPGFGK
jgi:hypothetical protein